MAQKTICWIHTFIAYQIDQIAISKSYIGANSKYAFFIILVLKKAFDTFDLEKRGCISTDMVRQILEMLGIQVTPKMFDEIISEVDADGIYFLSIHSNIALKISSNFKKQYSYRAVKIQIIWRYESVVLLILYF